MARKKERRRRQRIDVALPIKLEYGNKKISTKTKNISMLGIYIETDKEVPIGATLKIKVTIPKDKFAKAHKNKIILCVGTAFRCHHLESGDLYGIGIFFRSFPKDSEKILSKYIDYVLLQDKKIGKLYMQKRKHELLKRKVK